MKTILLALSFFIVYESFSQVTVNDLGRKTYRQVRAVETVSPCEDEDRIVTYCVADGSRLSYLFKGGILDQIMTMTAFATQAAAERQLEREIAEAKSSLGVEPFIMGGQTLFNTLDSPIFVSYGVSVLNQTYYMVHLIGKK
uniref:hypothetical protein n=1 Tax=Flavobacterium sp. TaxID=239 RepID=UPI00404B20CE